MVVTMRSSIVCFSQRATFVHRDVVSLIALDFILRVGTARVVRISLVINVFSVHPYDLAGDVASLRVPGYVIADIEFRCHHAYQKRATSGTTLRGRVPLEAGPSVVRFTFKVQVLN